MNLADRIQQLRKARGLSQEKLAEHLGVSRQAVTKWENGQSTPDVDKIIAMSDFFGVTTDYLLKGIEQEAAAPASNDRALISRVLYIVSTALIAIGLLCAFAGWYELQRMEPLAGGMVIQAVGAAIYFIARLPSDAKAPFYVTWLNVLGVTLMPVSMLTGWLSLLLFHQGWVAPYPVVSGPAHVVLFFCAYAIVAVQSHRFFKKHH